jgi:hypothetical protein
MEASPVFCFGPVKSRQLGIRADKILDWYVKCNPCYRRDDAIRKEDVLVGAAVQYEIGSTWKDKK